MNVDVKDLIEKLENFKDRMQDQLSASDDLLLAVVLAVLEEVE